MSSDTEQNRSSMSTTATPSALSATRASRFFTSCVEQSPKRPTMWSSHALWNPGTSCLRRFFHTAYGAGMRPWPMIGSRISARTPLLNAKGFSLSTSRTTTGSESTMNTLGPNASLNTPPYLRKYGYSAMKMGPPTRSSTEPSHTGAPSLDSSSPYVWRIWVIQSEMMSLMPSWDGTKSSSMSSSVDGGCGMPTASRRRDAPRDEGAERGRGADAVFRVVDRLIARRTSARVSLPRHAVARGRMAAGRGDRRGHRAESIGRLRPSSAMGAGERERAVRAFEGCAPFRRHYPKRIRRWETSTLIRACQEMEAP